MPLVLEPRTVYVAKPGTWFDAGTIAIPLGCVEEDPVMVWVGTKDGTLDEEVCPLDEFETHEVQCARRA